MAPGDTVCIQMWKPVLHPNIQLVPQFKTQNKFSHSIPYSGGGGGFPKTSLAVTVVSKVLQNETSVFYILIVNISGINEKLN
jgi:hypothetical protein